MQYKYITCNLPSNGLIYDTKEVHLRAKTIFDIKALLNNPAYQLKSEIDTLNNCINPDDRINVYDLVNQDVVYLLYKLRSLSDDTLVLSIDDVKYPIQISELDVKTLETWEPNRTLPESKLDVILAYTPIKNIFNLSNQRKEFEAKYPDYTGDVINTLNLLNAIDMINGVTDKDHIRNVLENLSWKDSLYLVNEIEKFQKLDFGVVEVVKIKNKQDEEIEVPIQLTEEFFRPSL